MTDAMLGLPALAATILLLADATVVAETVRDRLSVWLSGAEAHAPALLLGLALLLAVPLLALLGLAVRLLAAPQGGRGETAGLTPALHMRAAHAWLEVEGDPAHRVAINGEIVRIGREDDNELCIESGAVHRYHAVVQRTPDQDFVITDVSSGNGLRVNGETRTRSRLSHGDRLEIGGTAIRFHVEPTG